MFGRLAHHFSARRRGWPISSTVVQAILVLSAASLQSVTAAGEITSVPALMIVALLAFAASGQSSMAVTVGLAELDTSMVTGAIVSRTLLPAMVIAILWTDTAIKTSTLSDPKTFSAGNATRNRRVIFVASYAAGCILGATMSFGTAASLLVVCAIKLVIGVSFLLNRGKAASRFPAAVSARDEHYNPDTPMLKASWSD